jgi:hypothetical protein
MVVPCSAFVAPDRRGVGLTAVDRDRLRHPMTSDGLGQNACGRVLDPPCREENIAGLTRLIHRPIEVVPLAFDLGKVGAGRID